MGHAIDGTLCVARLAKPVAARHLVQVNAVGMIVDPAAVTGKQVILVVVFPTQRAGLQLEVILHVISEHRRVNFFNLGPVGNRVGGHDGAYDSVSLLFAQV